MLMLALLLSLAQATPVAVAPPDDREIKNAAAVRRYYPRSSLSRGEEGDVQFEVALNKNGKLTSCRIVESSGFPALDAATCDVVVETAQFKTTRVEDGGRTPSVHTGHISWRLPADVRPAKYATAETRIKPRNNERIICKRTLKEGSLVIVKKQCLSARDWDRQVGIAQSTTIGMQMPGGTVPF